MKYNYLFHYLIVFNYTVISLNASSGYVRVNQLGFLPNSIKVAVFISKDEVDLENFSINDALTDEIISSYSNVKQYGDYPPFKSTYRLDFSEFDRSGAFYIKANGVQSVNFRIGAHVYDGIADFILQYMRQQRCGYNPFLKDSCHTDDGYIIYHPEHDSLHIDVTGGWHDASDYLQYVTTSANAVHQMLFAYQQNPGVYEDKYNSDGEDEPNGIPDILDEARWGLDWLVKMNPDSGEMFNQIADDRDHMGFRLPNEDTISYGKGLERPVYFCNGEPQGVIKYKNRTDGIASTAGKYASAFALGSIVFREIDRNFSDVLRHKSLQAYYFGKLNPGVCQTAPCRAPYFYEEDNWSDDMELAAVQLYRLTGDDQFRKDALSFGDLERITPWMGADTAKHYQWYPFINLGHYYLAYDNGRLNDKFISYLRQGMNMVYERGKNDPFLFGIPFIWCSNNLVAAFITQANLYRKITGDKTFEEIENSMFDWLFGCNPWGTSMVVGLPGNGDTPGDTHSAFTHLYNYKIDGGLVDGPVYSTIYNKLLGITLYSGDEYSDVQPVIAVYHDDYGDYSTNEPTMDGTASLSYYFSEMEKRAMHQPKRNSRDYLYKYGSIIRGDTTQKKIYLLFTGGDYADGAEIIFNVLDEHNIKAMFFFTGDYLRKKDNTKLINKLRRAGHYIGAHSDKHLLYADWSDRDSTLISKQEFKDDLKNNYKELSDFGIMKEDALYYLPPYEWYNTEISEWTKELGLKLINFTPGTYSNADYTFPEMNESYFSSDKIMNCILNYEKKSPSGLNGFLLLTHVGTDKRRSDKFYNRLDELIIQLKEKGYVFGVLE
ncbi:MAG: glycoside hydrolase family 9 protein [Melioribacteraceae bacterium]|nr:glycoside hydrolase family 9 protein [Melioribacteraceae bacterium]